MWISFNITKKLSTAGKADVQLLNLHKKPSIFSYLKKKKKKEKKDLKRMMALFLALKEEVIG